jgi:hypothetical protein
MPRTVPPEQIPDEFKQSFECWQSGELDLMEDTYADDAELDVSAVFTDTRPYRGKESMRRYWDEVWGLYTLRPSDNKIVPCQLFPTVHAAMDSARAG